jgi:chromatin segregation and condensation protein Rec8/ScpA/Scc1 (kleisin family)
MKIHKPEHFKLKIEDVIERLLERVKSSFKNLSFKEFSSSMSVAGKTLEEKKSAFVVSFLAMLELIKNGVLNAEQGEGHNEIEISNISSENGDVKNAIM